MNLKERRIVLKNSLQLNFRSFNFAQNLNNDESKK